MDPLKTAVSTIVPAMKSVGPAGRAMIIGALILLLGIGSFLFNQRDAEKQIMLFGGRDLSRAEINTIENALGAAACNEYEVIDGRIRIPISCRSEILKAIDDAGATPRSVSGLQQSEPVFNPFLTGSQQKSLEKEKKQRKICAMIREINGISEVMVEYDETRSSGFPRKTERTAAVTVRPDGQQHLKSYEVETIRSMVRRAVAGMEPDDIVVIDGNSGIAHHWQDGQKDSQTLRSYAAAKQQFEESWKQKIENVLKSYPGAEVNVQVEFDQIAGNTLQSSVVASDSPLSNSRLSNSKQTVDAKIVHASIEQNASVTQQISQTSTAAPFRSGMPGSNGQARVADFSPEELASKTQQPQTHQTVSHKTFVKQPAQHAVGRAVSQAAYNQQPSGSSRSDFVPTSASVSIVIPQSLVASYARRLNSARHVQEAPTETGDSDSGASAKSDTIVTTTDIETCFLKLKDDITRRIVPLLPGSQQVTDPDRLIAVAMEMDLKSATVVTSDGFELQEMFSNIDFGKLGNNWYAWAVPALAIVGFVMLRISSRANANAVRQDRISRDVQQSRRQTERHGGQRNQVTPPVVEHNDLEPTEQEAQLANGIDKAFDSERDSLSREVVDIIRHDPEATVRVFRTWLNEMEN